MNKYLIEKDGKEFKLQNTQTNDLVIVDRDHKKYKWVEKNMGRVVTITDTRWASSKDYNGLYNNVDTNTGSTHQKKELGPIKLTKLDDLNIDLSLFTPMKTDTIWDDFISQDGGVLPGSNIMAAGAPGIGKTTILLDMLAKLHEKGKKVLFISAEMSQIDMARYLKRFPKWGKLSILFLSDWVDECPKTVIEKVLEEGWDLVLTDSYTEVNDTVKEECGLTKSRTEKWFLDLMIKHNKGENKTLTYTAFITILQLNKGGQFVGSNKLKHLTTSMLHLDWDGKENSGLRYMEFSKNRVGQVGKKLYFSLDNGVQLDSARWERDLHSDDMLNVERESLLKEESAFDRLFGFEKEVEEMMA